MPNKVLGLPGIGPKAMQNIDESFAAMKFPEPSSRAEPVVEEPVAEHQLPWSNLKRQWHASCC